mmetsp:Transcript_15327/g.44352  ORF Transcript_15327/g.44352 Transcript_15327/m.44352 type:complete len:240 (-) Transcript_15327:818-1537(-)
MQLVDGHLGEEGALAALLALLVHLDALPHAVQDVAGIEQAVDLSARPEARRVVLVEEVAEGVDIGEDSLVVEVDGGIGTIGILGRSLTYAREEMFEYVLGLVLDALASTGTGGDGLQPLGAGEAKTVVEVGEGLDQALLAAVMLPEYDGVEGECTAHHATMLTGGRIGVGMAIQQVIGGILPGTTGAVDGLNARPEQSGTEPTAKGMDEGRHDRTALLVAGTCLGIVLKPTRIVGIVFT